MKPVNFTNISEKMSQLLQTKWKRRTSFKYININLFKKKQAPKKRFLNPKQ